MTAPDALLHRLAESYGIATEFWDWRGAHVTVPAETIIRVLDALGVDAGTPEAAQAAADGIADRDWQRMLPPTVVVRQGQSLSVYVHVTHHEPVSIWVELENGGTREDLVQEDNWSPPRQLGERLVGEATFRLPADLPLGYHTLHASSPSGSGSAAVIVTPTWVGLPARLGRQRSWGVAAQIYSVRSEQSWGVGDAVDLADLAVWSAGQGAGYVLINPLHAAEPVPPLEPSPYLPTTRRFQNPLYLRPERIPEFADLDQAARDAVQAEKAALAATLSGQDAIRRDPSWTAKQRALELVHAVPRTAGRELAYRQYCDREGDGLLDFATWCALVEEHGADWHEWPEDLRHPRSTAVVEFRRAHEGRVDWYRWLQWVLDEQLAVAQATARRAGMALGVMHDLAVGVHPRGADAWALQDVFATGMTVGAPPDTYNQAGQDWSQPPWRPDRLAEVGYAPFRRMVATVLRSAGGLRVDHIIGMFRLWWIPAGLGPKNGTYVRYDHEALIGILALEAVRAQAVVVGEDLGTVEPWVRDYLRDRGILGTSILWFEYEMDAGGAAIGPLPAEKWREYCLASVTTHDLPPSAAYLAGDHVRLRHDLGLLTRSLDEELDADEAERAAWLIELRRRGALSDDAAAATADGLDPDAPDAPADDVRATVEALHRYLSWTPARLLGVSLTDLVGDRRGQNQPGTIDEYPNWRVPLSGPDGQPISLEDVFSSERAAALAAIMRG